MRFAWVIHGALEQRTGGYVYDAEIVHRLRAAGDRVEIVSIASDSDPSLLLQRLIEADCDAIVGDALAARELGWALSRYEGRTPRVLLVHHLKSWEREARSRPLLREEEGRAIGASDRLVATSRWTAGRLQREYDCTPDVVIPGADRLPRLVRHASADGRVALAFVGSLIPRKRLALLLEAFERVSRPNLELRIIGDPTRDPAHAASIRDRLERAPYLRKRVTMLGLVDDERLARELALADALILPSSLEGYGMVLGEALHAGVPVIATRMGPIAEVVGTGECGLLFDEEQGLTTLLARFASEPVLRERMRIAAEERALVLPTWDHAAAAFRGVLTRAAAAREYPARSNERTP